MFFYIMEFETPVLILFYKYDFGFGHWKIIFNFVCSVHCIYIHFVMKKQISKNSSIIIITAIAPVYKMFEK